MKNLSDQFVGIEKIYKEVGMNHPLKAVGNE